MKKHYLLFAAIVTSSANAYIVNLDSLPEFGDPSTPFLDNTGAPIAFNTGGLRIGYFSRSDEEIRNAASFTSLLDPSSFIQFTTETKTIGTDTVGPDPVPGIVLNTDLSAPISATENTAFAGQPIYVVVSETGAFDDSDLLAVFKTTAVFALDGDAGEGATTAVVGGPLTTDNLLIGQRGGAISFQGVDFGDSIQLVSTVPIPEPSTSLLAALAGLGLVARRRR